MRDDRIHWVTRSQTAPRTVEFERSYYVVLSILRTNVYFKTDHIYLF